MLADAAEKGRNAAGSDKRWHEILSWLIKNSPGIRKASSRFELQRDGDVVASFLNMKSNLRREKYDSK